ncbi:MAG: hypothetical protein ABF293_12015 [Flavobacteriaceae bacterium]
MLRKWILLLLVSSGWLLGCSTDDDNNALPNGDTVNKSANLLSAGESAGDILSNNNFSNLLIEIAYVEGFRPTQEAMDAFEAYLRARTFKSIIEIQYNPLPSPNQESLTIQEVANLEDDNRENYNEGNTLAIYIYFADAPDDSDDEDSGLVTLGSVYRNTSMVIYEQTIRDLAAKSILISVADVESATLNHEFGHLFGLVDLGTSMVNDHEDILLDDDGNPELDNNGNPIGNSHCDVNGCLMRAELQFGGGIMGMLESRAARGLAIPDLDAECILDLQGNGGR